MTIETEVPEWASRQETLDLSAEEIVKVLELNRNPPEPNDALLRAVQLHREEVDRRAKLLTRTPESDG